MARPARLDFPGACHHVMNRGARREVILGDDRTLVRFLAILGSLPERFGVRVHGFALMPNHFHLMLESTRGNLSRAMQHLQAAFTQEHNRLHPGWDGPLFRGRFKNLLVEDQAYWRHLLAYLHLNPVAAHLIPWLDDSSWTSHADYAGLRRPPDWLSTDALLAQFGGVEPYLRYVREVHIGRQSAPPNFEPDALWRPRRTERLVPLPLHRADLSIPVDLALEQVCEIAGTTPENLRKGHRGVRGDPERWLAAWWLERAAGLSHREIATLLSADGAQVSRWCRRVARGQAGVGFDAWKAALSELNAPPPLKTSEKSIDKS